MLYTSDLYYIWHSVLPQQILKISLYSLVVYKTVSGVNGPLVILDQVKVWDNYL